MNIESTHVRYSAVSMELAAYLDGHYVEMHILTDTGKTVSIVCERDSIFSVQRNIARLGYDCPEIATWKPGTYVNPRHDNLPEVFGAAARKHRRISLRNEPPLVVDAAWSDWTEIDA